MEPEPKTTKNSHSFADDILSFAKNPFLIAMLVIFLILAGLSLKSLFVIRPSFTKKELTIGALTTPLNKKDAYDKLAAYLADKIKEKTGQEVTIKVEVIDVINKGALKDAQNKVASRQWDIAFTTEPFVSIKAINTGYRFVAAMFPSYTTQVAIIVKKESPIKSLQDISETTRLAMGDPNSAGLYYMPIFNLYGTRFIGVLKNNIGDIQKALEGKYAEASENAEAAVVLYINSQLAEFSQSAPSQLTQSPLVAIKEKINNGDYRIISLSRRIPAGSVYISPNFVEEKTLLEEILIDAPKKEIKQAAQYDRSPWEIDYSIFNGLQKRVDNILNCAEGDPINTRIFKLDIKECGDSFVGTISSIRQIMPELIELIVKSDGSEYGIKIRKNILVEKLNKTFADTQTKGLEYLFSNSQKVCVQISDMIANKPDPNSSGGSIKYFDINQNTRRKMELTQDCPKLSQQN